MTDYECIKAALPGLEAQIGRIRNKGQRRRTRKELARTVAKVELRAEVARMRGERADVDLVDGRGRGRA